MKNRLNIFSVISICGTCISFYIGAGFATMQEIVQYEVSYGSLFPVVIIITAIIYIYTNISFATNGNKLRLQRGGEIYKVYCSILGEKFSKVISIFFDYFSAFFCYMSFIVMCGGANSTASQQWDLPLGIGSIVLTFLVICTVIFGLDGILRTLSKIGPLIIIMILVISIITAFSGSNNLFTNINYVDKGYYSNVLKQVGKGNPFSSGASYGGFVILWFAAFFAEIGSKKKLREASIGMLFSAVFIFSTAFICCIALFGHLNLIADADIPALILATQISPILAQVFAIIIYIGIYTSAVPLLWTSIRKVTKEGTTKYKIITIIGGVFGCIIAIFIPYKGLINILYGLNGYLGFILMFFMIIYDIKTKFSNRIL